MTPEEAIAEKIKEYHALFRDPKWGGTELLDFEYGELGKAGLQGLESAGFRVFRPDDCDTVSVDAMSSRGDGPLQGWTEAGDYWLVPVEETKETK